MRLVFLKRPKGKVYILVNVEDVSSKKSKEICRFYSNLSYALKLDSNASVDNSKRTFAFSSPEALGFNNYDETKLDSIYQSVSFNELYELAINHPSKLSNIYSGENQKYVVHLLFNFGVISSKESNAGTLVSHPIELKKYSLKRLPI